MASCQRQPHNSTLQTVREGCKDEDGDDSRKEIDMVHMSVDAVQCFSCFCAAPTGGRFFEGAFFVQQDLYVDGGEWLMAAAGVFNERRIDECCGWRLCIVLELDGDQRLPVDFFVAEKKRKKNE